MPKVDDILNLLENGNWHDLKEIRKKIPDYDVTLIYDLDGKPVFPQDSLILHKNWSVRIVGSY